MKHGMKTVLLAGTLALLAGAAAMAADSFTIKANVPFDFMVGNQRVEAGEYLVTQDTAHSAVRIISRDSGAALIVLRHPAGKNTTGLPYALVFNKYGGQHFLREVWAGVGVDGVRLPASRTEKELMASRAPVKTTLMASVVR